MKVTLSDDTRSFLEDAAYVVEDLAKDITKLRSSVGPVTETQAQKVIRGINSFSFLDICLKIDIEKSVRIHKENEVSE